MNRLEKAANVSSRTRKHRDIVKNESQNAKHVLEANELDTSENSEVFKEPVSVLHDIHSNYQNCSHFLDSRCDYEFEKLYRPFTEYWMCRCNFSRVKLKNFRQLKKYMPANFLWLLGECAKVVEMAEVDLYEEVCLVESYYGDVLRTKDCPSTRNQYRRDEYRTRAHYNRVTKKW